MTMALAAEVAGPRRIEEEARSLSMSDPLTGMGNYRKLINVLEAEIKRSERTKKPFLFFLVDLDGLKKINDTYGHLAGNRALCRLANVLRLHCRNIDTAARYGGDEFALIVPEAGVEAAPQLADRIARRLGGDGDLPALSVSIGVAVWPQDGTTLEALLRAADSALYEMKNTGGWNFKRTAG